MSAVTVTNWGMNLVVAVTFLTLVAVLGQAGTFWLYGVISGRGLGLCVICWCRKPKGRLWNKLKRTGERESLHGHYESMAKRILMRTLSKGCRMTKESSMKPANPRILTINGGSSSIKFALFEAGDSLRRILEGGIERIGLPEATLRVKGLNQADNFSRPVTAPDHTAAVGAADGLDRGTHRA